MNTEQYNQVQRLIKLLMVGFALFVAFLFIANICLYERAVSKSDYVEYDLEEAEKAVKYKPQKSIFTKAKVEDSIKFRQEQAKQIANFIEKAKLSSENAKALNKWLIPAGLQYNKDGKVVLLSEKDWYRELKKQQVENKLSIREMIDNFNKECESNKDMPFCNNDEVKLTVLPGLLESASNAPVEEEEEEENFEETASLFEQVLIEDQLELRELQEQERQLEERVDKIENQVKKNLAISEMIAKQEKELQEKLDEGEEEEEEEISEDEINFELPKQVSQNSTQEKIRIRQKKVVNYLTATLQHSLRTAYRYKGSRAGGSQYIQGLIKEYSK